MIDANSIIIKTDKGKDELKNRTYRLSSRLRSLLFMVENESFAKVLLEKASKLGDETLLQELIDQGFVAVNGLPEEKSANNSTPLPVNQGVQGRSEMQVMEEKEFIEIKALVLNCIKVGAGIWDMRSLTNLVSAAHTPDELLSSYSMVEQKLTDKTYKEMLEALKLRIVALKK